MRWPFARVSITFEDLISLQKEKGNITHVSRSNLAACFMLGQSLKSRSARPAAHSCSLSLGIWDMIEQVIPVPDVVGVQELEGMEELPHDKGHFFRWHLAPVNQCHDQRMP